MQKLGERLGSEGKKLVLVMIEYPDLEETEPVLMRIPGSMTQDELQDLIDKIKNEFDEKGIWDWSDEDVFEELEKHGIEILNPERYYVSI